MSRLPDLLQPSQKTGDGGAMLLDSHGGGVGEPGEGEYIQSVEEDHQEWEDGGSSLRSVIPLQSNLCGPPTQLPNSSLDWSGSGGVGRG